MLIIFPIVQIVDFSCSSFWTNVDVVIHNYKSMKSHKTTCYNKEFNKELRKAQPVLFAITVQFHLHASQVRLWNESLRNKIMCIC